MGFQVSPIVCNLYMEDFERHALESTHPARWWKRYEDDMPTHWSSYKAHAQEFTDHRNSIDDDIKWMTKGKLSHTQKTMRRGLEQKEHWPFWIDSTCT